VKGGGRVLLVEGSPDFSEGGITRNATGFSRGGCLLENNGVMMNGRRYIEGKGRGKGHSSGRGAMRQAHGAPSGIKTAKGKREATETAARETS